MVFPGGMGRLQSMKPSQAAPYLHLKAAGYTRIAMNPCVFVTPHLVLARSAHKIIAIHPSTAPDEP